MTEQGGVERFKQPVASGEWAMTRHSDGQWIRYSDHLERVEELEQQAREERVNHEERREELWVVEDQRDHAEARAEKAEAERDALQALLSEAVGEFELVPATTERSGE